MLPMIWFILITVLFIGFFFLEGFDFGVGILTPFLGKNDTDRRVVRLLSGELDFQRSFLILLLVPEFYLPIRLLGSQFHTGQNGTAAAKRIFEILQTEPQGLIERDDYGDGTWLYSRVRET